jgi:hypothetical protein
MRFLRSCLWCTAALLRWTLRLAAVLGIAALAVLWAVRHAPVAVPPKLVDRLSVRVNQDLAAIGVSARLGRVEIDLRENLSPAVVLDDLALFDRAGDLVVALDRVEAVFSRDDALLARPVPKAVTARGVQVALSRDAEGRLTLQLGDATLLRGASSPAEALERLRARLAEPRLAGLRAIGLDRVGITLNDARDGRRITSRDGALRITRDDAGRLALDADLGVFDDGGGGSDAGRVQVHVISPGGGAQSDLRLTVRGLEPARLRGLAGPGPLDDLLTRLRAPVSLDLEGAIGADGTPRPLAGHLNVGAGAIVLPGAAADVALDGLSADLHLSADRSHLAVADLSLRSSLVSGAGRIDLRRGSGDGLTAQLALSEVRASIPRRDRGAGDGSPGAVAGTGALRPVAARLARAAPAPGGGARAPLLLGADRLWADLRIDRNSGALGIGALTLEREGVRAVGRGVLDRGGTGGAPRLALDLHASDPGRAGLFALWPVGIAPRTRDWLDSRLGPAEVTDLRLALRQDFGTVDAPDLALDFDFAGAEIAVSDGLPPLREARGHGALAGGAFGLRLVSGLLPVPGGGAVTLEGATAHIGRLGRDLAPLRITLGASAALPDALRLLRQPLFQPRAEGASAAAPRPGANPGLPDQAGVGAVDAATKPGAAPDGGVLMAPGALSGRVRVDLALDLALGPKATRPPPDFSLDGEILGARSDTLLPGRSLSAERLHIAVNPARVTIRGAAQLDSVPFDLLYERGLGLPRRLVQPVSGRPSPRPLPPAPPGRGRLSADLPLTAAALSALGVSLPPGTLRGQGSAQVSVDLSADGPAELLLRADLTGLGISVPALGIRKPPGAAGSANLAGRIGGGAVLDRIALRLPGARLDASARMPGGGAPGTLVLDRVVLGRWLDARGLYVPGGRLALTGGTLDLRHLPPRPDGAGDPAGPGIDVALDRVRLAEGLDLTELRGALSPRLHGSLTGTVNGIAPVRLRLAHGAPQDGTDGGTGQQTGLALHLTGEDAGAVLRAANLVPFLHGGALDLRLVPRGVPGSYRGQLRIIDTAIRDGPAGASFLSAISVVGAAEQASGNGIGFSDIRADFMLSRDRIDLMAASATGPSIGMSLDGTVNLATRVLDLQGVVSPIYFLNRVGSFMTRRGEGLIGLHYTVTGPMSAPRLAANPLSVLTPGFLREVFRGQNGQGGVPGAGGTSEGSPGQ